MQRQPRRQTTAVLERTRERRPDEPADLVDPPILAVPVPEHDLVALSHPAAPHETPDDEDHRKIEPGDSLRTLEDEVTDDRVIGAVADPVLSLRRGRDAGV